jgi:RimJ/RimL family protein N-acetyltransferase
LKNTAEAEYRALESRDQDFLFDMLFEAIYVPPGSATVDRSILKLPEIRKYAADWGSRKGDLGLLISIKENPVGAIWLRFFSEEKQGYGYVADKTPELSMALLPEFRGRGYGTEMLKRLLKDLPQEIRCISLSVDPGNPALHLYEKFGFKKCGECGTSITMLLNRNSR